MHFVVEFQKTTFTVQKVLLTLFFLIRLELHSFLKLHWLLKDLNIKIGKAALGRRFDVYARRNCKRRGLSLLILVSTPRVMYVYVF